MQLLHSYTNGNTQVEIYSDGTKKRYYEGVAKPLHPESIDVKITNYCDGGCAYCHEQSTTKGVHGNLNDLFATLSTLPAGVEIALGGGNPLSHPDLVPFLVKLKESGIIANMTINEKHLGEYKYLIIDLISKDLIKGVGISYHSSKYLVDIAPLLLVSSNIVFHMIMGVNVVEDVDVLAAFCADNNRKCKILVLGYKQFGFGINYYVKNKNIEDNKYRWYTKLATYFKRDNLILSFDNLGIEQLKLQRYFTDTAWDKFFMGKDFTFSMYIDGVKQNYAPSSTSSTRVSFQDETLLGYFQKNRLRD